MDTGGEGLVSKIVLHYFCNDLKSKLGDFKN